MNTDYEYHPIANIFPLMTDAEIDELAEDIKANGLTCPIILFQGKILDGRNRYLACQRAGVVPDFWEYPGETPVQFVLSLNLHRRHLTTSQRAAIAADVANLQDGQRADYAAAPNGAPVTQSEAADLLGVGHRTVQRAAAVRTADPELHQQVRAGEISLEDARRTIPTARPQRSRKRKTARVEVDDEAQNVNGTETPDQATHVPESLNKESADRGECMARFKDFVRNLSKEFHRPQKDIIGFIKVYLLRFL
jgi:ParB-like chromosome segregation protein Spo0J